MNKKFYQAKISLLAFIFPVLLLPAFVSAQDDKEDSAEQASSLTGFTLTQEEEAFTLGGDSDKEPPSESKEEEQKITALDIKGNKAASTSVILSKIKMRAGQNYSLNTAREDIKRLYNTGNFSDIKIETEDHLDGLKVIFIVKEKPIIDKINFKGLKAISRERVNKTLNSKVGSRLDYPKLNQDVKEITTIYDKKGFSSVLVDYKVDLDEAQEKAGVEFIIEEGRRIKVKKIAILGADNFKEKRILKLMKTKKKWWFGAGLFQEDVLEEDMEKIASFYRNHGFVDVKISKEVERYPAQGNIYIAVTIDEGKKYTVGSIRFEGNVAGETGALKEGLKMIEGDVFTEDALRDDGSAIQAYYLEMGYIFARVIPGTSLNPDTGKVDISYSVTENELAYVNRINIRGNIKTKDKVIRRELRLNPGDKFDGKKLKRSKERLNNLGFFEEVNFDMEDTTEANTKDLVVEVKEAKTGEISFGGGYSSVDKLIGFVEIAQRNFDFKNFQTFTGAGQDLRLKAQLGALSNSFDLSFTEPWIFDWPLSFGFDAYNTAHDRASDVGYGYDEERTGADLRLGKEISEFTRAGLTYRIETVNIGDIPTEATNDLKKEEGENLVSSLGFSITRDSRDNIYSPTRGLVLGGSADMAGGVFGGDKDFFRLMGMSTYDLPVFRVGKVRRGEDVKYSVLELRLRAGIMDEFDNSDSVPIYERFYVGGSNSVRGYNERRIGPLDTVTEDPLGGEAMLVGNIEYTYPLFDFIKGAAFYDVGNVWADSTDLGNGGFKAGMGLGVRIKTPIGPVKLDYGIPLNEEPGEDTKSGKFHFSISRGF